MYRTTAYVGHFLARFERDVKLYMSCAALIGFSARREALAARSNSSHPRR